MLTIKQHWPGLHLILKYHLYFTNRRLVPGANTLLNILANGSSKSHEHQIQLLLKESKQESLTCVTEIG